LFVLVAIAALVAALSAAAAESAALPPRAEMSYLTNQAIRLGVDLNLGGAITYLAPVTNRQANLINSFDWGRQVQLSYYSGPVPFQPPGAKLSAAWRGLGWNPIQSGDCYGHRSRVLQHTNDGHSLYLKCVPMQWPLENVPGDCVCEVWLELAGPVVNARCRLTNHRADLTQYPARMQELPAVYVNGPFSRLMTYRGDRPFTGAALSQIEARLERGAWGHWLATENWAAEVNAAGWGLGVWNPGAYAFSGGFAGEPGDGGPLDSPTGYIAPNRDEILDHNITYDYAYALIVGTLQEIRNYVYQRPRPALPNFRFAHDRQGWYYAEATDAGWPIRGELDVTPAGKTPQLLSPLFFVPAERASRLALEAAWTGSAANLAVHWRHLGEAAFPPQRAQTLPLQPDGQFHAYSLNLAAAPNVAGAITQLRLDLPAGGRIRLKSVAFSP